MSTSLALSTRELKHKRRENAANRNLEYFKAGMAAIKPIVASKPFLAVGGTLAVYKLERSGYMDGWTAGLLSAALLGWLAADVVDALLPG